MSAPIPVTQSCVLPEDWADPILTRAAAAALLAQPGHLLLTTGSGHLLARLMEGAVADVLTLFVHPAHRRRGHAAALLKAFLEAAHQTGCTAAAFEVRASNLAAQSLYQTYGFAKVGRRTGYYTNPPEDAVILTLSLAPQSS